uniref:Uncharacterized protein n=1 Tax=Mola mola TaxID=94237 RepID=A0A3Q4AQU6_MOLML
SFGDKDFRSGLENGILLCELLSAIKPGLVKKINRLPTPIAGLDNLSVFLRGCEELGLKGAQLFDPGDLQDTSVRANLKDSDCNRKLKNVLNTVFWLGKAAGGCASYSGPFLNLKEFEGLLAQMKECDEGGESPQKRSVRDSGYDCWDSERSESLSPPRHTRDNSLDSLNSFGSHSQHSPSPDVVNRGNNDDRKPDVRKDDMLARRTASSESRSSVAFNQFLPSRTNAGSYIPTPRRRPTSQFLPVPGSVKYNFTVLFLCRSVSMGDILNDDEVGHLPPLSQSRYEHMHEQYNSVLEDEEHWQDDLARWKNRRRSASQELIKKEEERKRMEKRMKEEGGDSNKRKSIKTYKEIVEDKERREAELCEAYRNAATPEEAAMVLQRYALRFIISDATLDSLKLPRSTANIKQDPNHVDKEHKTESPISHSETSELVHKPKPGLKAEQMPTKPDTLAQQQTLSNSSSPPTPGSPLGPVSPSPQPEEQSPPPHTQEQIPPPQPEEQSAPPQPEEQSAPPQPGEQSAPPQPEEQSAPPQPGEQSPPPHTQEQIPPPQPEEQSAPPQPEEQSAPPQPGEQSAPPQTEEQSAPPNTENLSTFSGSAISSLIGGHNCVITTTIVTELNQTCVEPYHQSNGQIETPMLNLAKRVNHWVWDPNEERKRLESWQQEQERLLQEQYQREQEKLKKEWEKAQLEVEEEERKHNEEERRILEETVTCLTPTGLLNQQFGQTGKTPSTQGNKETERGNAPLQKNSQRSAAGNEDQHASKLHFFQDSAFDGKPLKKQELWKTASLDRNPQLNPAHVVKRYAGCKLECVNTRFRLNNPSVFLLLCVCRCVSGKRLCSGCSQPLERGAAMIIDTLGLFFHMQCFKCGVCNRQLGDATSGTDVRIRNGLLSCHECYIASRGEITHVCPNTDTCTHIQKFARCYIFVMKSPN